MKMGGDCGCKEKVGGVCVCACVRACVCVCVCVCVRVCVKLECVCLQGVAISILTACEGPQDLAGVALIAPMVQMNPESATPFKVHTHIHPLSLSPFLPLSLSPSLLLPPL